LEKTVFITHCGQLKCFNAKNYSRLYYGNEFCERLIPSQCELQKALGFAKKNDMNFSLVTPYVTDFGLEKLKALFNIVKDLKISPEVIVNDWGVLKLIKDSYPSLEPVLGRLLVKQKRGPGLKRLLERKSHMIFVRDSRNPQKKILLVQKKLPPGLDYYYKGSNAASVPILHDFLLSCGVRRIELDNPEQGIILNLPKGSISASVYIPYCYIATTFFCLTAGCDEKKHSFLKIKLCKRECRKYIFELRHKSFQKVLYLKGNTQFYKNSTFNRREYLRMGVDRIVYEPEIPV
jgi:hypothetical protein